MVPNFSFLISKRGKIMPTPCKELLLGKIFDDGKKERDIRGSPSPRSHSQLIHSSGTSQGPESPGRVETSATGWPAGPLPSQLPRPGNRQAQPTLIAPILHLPLVKCTAPLIGLEHQP